MPCKQCKGNHESPQAPSIHKSNKFKTTFRVCFFIFQKNAYVAHPINSQEQQIQNNISYLFFSFSENAYVAHPRVLVFIFPLRNPFSSQVIYWELLDNWPLMFSPFRVIKKLLENSNTFKWTIKNHINLITWFGPQIPPKLVYNNHKWLPRRLIIKYVNLSN